MNMQVTKLILIVVVLVVVSAPRLHGQDPLLAARELYASAEYENALQLLDGLAIGSASRDEQQAIQLYRALCLLAVGRRADAEESIELMIAKDPLYRPTEDVPPRMRTAFSDVRKRVLPAIVQQHYSEAKTAFDRQDFAIAAAAFKRVVEELNDPDITQAVAQPPLSDLRTLATGFRDLSVKAIPPPAPPPPPVQPSPPETIASRIYTGEEPGVVAPVPIRQEMPRYPGVVRMGGLKGMMEIVINEQGNFESGRMRVPIDPRYDSLLLTAASQWQYSPAMADGRPVKFLKRIQITLSESRP
jgi:hypothetical protein